MGTTGWRRDTGLASAGAEPSQDTFLGRIGGSGSNALRGRLAGPFDREGLELQAISPRQGLVACRAAAKTGCCPPPLPSAGSSRSFTAIRKDAGLYCGTRLRKGEVFAYVGLPQNLKDLKNVSRGSILRNQAERGHRPIILLVMVRVMQNAESSSISSVKSSTETALPPASFVEAM